MYAKKTTPAAWIVPGAATAPQHPPTAPPLGMGLRRTDAGRTHRPNTHARSDAPLKPYGTKSDQLAGFTWMAPAMITKTMMKTVSAIYTTNPADGRRVLEGTRRRCVSAPAQLALDVHAAAAGENR